MSLAFRRMTEADLPRVNGWLAQPHVAPWWDDPLVAEDLREPHHRLWLAEDAAGPFAFLQDYDPHAAPGHLFADLPSGSRGIDLFIGEPDRLGRGAELIRSFTGKLLAEGAPAVGADPRPDNDRAVRAFTRAGFAVSGPARPTGWGLCLPMTRYAP